MLSVFFCSTCEISCVLVLKVFMTELDVSLADDNTEQGAKSFGFSLVGCRGGAIFLSAKGIGGCVQQRTGDGQNNSISSVTQNGSEARMVTCSTTYSKITSKENFRKEQTRKLYLPVRWRASDGARGNLSKNDENEEWTNFYATATVKCTWSERIHREEQRSLRITIIGNVKTPNEKSRIIVGNQIQYQQ